MKTRPLKTIIIGVLLTMVLSIVAGIPLIMAFADSPSTNMELALSMNPTYLSLSLILFTVCAIFSAYFATKSSQGAEIKYGIIIGAVVILVTLPFWVAGNSFKVYPVWYSVLSFALPLLAGYLGGLARNRKA